MTEELLRVDEASGGYIEKKVLNHFNFTVYTNETVCLFGFNGSGKTSFIRLILGMIEGNWNYHVYYRGTDVDLKTRDDAAILGIRGVFSETSLIEKMTVAENLDLLWQNPLRLIRRHNDDTVKRLLNFYGMSYINMNQKIHKLDMVDKYLLEMVRAASCGTKLLFLDCMEAFVNPVDIRKLKHVLHCMNAMGTSVVYLCNKLDSHLLFASRMVIIRDGMRIKEMLGPDYCLKDLQSYAAGSTRQQPEINQIPSAEPILPGVFSVDGLRAGDYTVSFSARRGSVLGIYCTDEKALHKIAYQFFTNKINCDNFTFEGRQTNGNAQRKQIKRFFRVVQSLGEKDILFRNLSILDNILIGGERLAMPPMHIVRKDLSKAVYEENCEMIERAKAIRASGTMTRVINMEILTQRLFLQGVRVVIMNQPFLGLDVVSLKEVARNINKLAQRGVSIVILSKDMWELRQLGSVNINAERQ